MAIRLSISSERLKSSSERSTFPDSILLMSSTSLISPSKCLLDEVIFFRHSETLPGSSRWEAAMAVMPTIAFIGVRISWLILERNVVFAAFAS